MADQGTPRVDHGTLAHNLQALSNAIRLEILDQLRLPKSLSEIRVKTHGQSTDPRPRTVTRQTVRHHLDILMDVDLVRPERPGGAAADHVQYRVHPQRLYAVVEDLRNLSVNRVRYAAETDETGTVVDAPATRPVVGPRLVLVHGVHEGKMFSLAPGSGRGEGGVQQWVIGRARDAEIRLDYDPFVSLENALVTLRGGVYEVEDLRTSKNGTRINWAEVPPGSRQRLRPGHVLGVGRSLLCFAEE